jgi:cyclopropane-fatty-acyl-phospholipid synthase
MKKRVAIIGGGVSGLSAAWHIVTSSSSEEYDVTVFESEPRLGGHAWTIRIPEKEIDVDVGFMVFNKENYPNMMHWFDALGVQMEKSDMSFSVSIDRDMDLWNPFRIEWSSRGIKGLFATSSKLQILNPEFYRFLFDMVRFNREAASILLLHDQDPRKHVTTGQYLRDYGYSNAFAKCYLLPMMAALWSASMKDVLDFPAAQLVGFLCNHKMLQLFDRPQVIVFLDTRGKKKIKIN